MKRLLLLITLLFGLLLPVNLPASADVLVVSEDRSIGYKRSLFKHWIDADKNGCDTRAEVLIEEAIVKPKKGKKCALTGGKWLSAYDGKTTIKASDLDIDHAVPLAEAWRSGAWAWTPLQRQSYANDLTESRALIAVSLGQNRSKGDRDVSGWLPLKGVCAYIETWITIKVKYSLTVDSKEMSVLSNYIESCGLVELETPTQAPTATPSPTPTVTATPTPTATKVKPAPIKYKNCTEAKAAGVTPIRKTTDPELYALNTALDGDKDGDACES